MVYVSKYKNKYSTQLNDDISLVIKTNEKRRSIRIALDLSSFGLFWRAAISNKIKEINDETEGIIYFMDDHFLYAQYVVYKEFDQKEVESEINYLLASIYSFINMARENYYD